MQAITYTKFQRDWMLGNALRLDHKFSPQARKQTKKNVVKSFQYEGGIGERRGIHK